VREALQSYRELIALHPKEAVHHLQIAAVLLSAGLGEVARAEVQAAVKLEPTSALAEKTLADILESRPLSPHHRFVIAMHSPDGIVETELLRCLPEKMAAKLACGIEQDTLSGPVASVKLAELRRFRAIFSAMRANFSAVQTAWRRGDSPHTS
jgi:hypothetical protein